MKKLSEQVKSQEFLKAKRRGNIEWEGYIPDIFNEGTIEMKELIDYLSEVR